MTDAKSFISKTPPYHLYPFRMMVTSPPSSRFSFQCDGGVSPAEQILIPV